MSGAGGTEVEYDTARTCRGAPRRARIRQGYGLGSERGLATPSPDEKGRESLSPVEVDHAAGTLTHARTQLRTRLIYRNSET